MALTFLSSCSRQRPAGPLMREWRQGSQEANGPAIVGRPKAGPQALREQAGKRAAVSQRPGLAWDWPHPDVNPGSAPAGLGTLGTSLDFLEPYFCSFVKWK